MNTVPLPNEPLPNETRRQLLRIVVYDVEPLSSADELARQWKRHLLVIALFLAAAVVVMPVDVGFSKWFYGDLNGRPKLLRNIFDNTVCFGHGVGVAVIALVALCLDQRRPKIWMSLVTTALTAGFAANLVKFVVGRVRPRDFHFASADVSDTFRGWLPLLRPDAHSPSMPSAHTATAVAMGIMLATAYPRGRYLFALLAVFVAGHRLHSGAHYLSDVFVGAAIGWVVGQTCRWAALRYEYVRT